VGRRFEDAVAVVTGGASGIGRATAQRLAREGAQVVVFDRATASFEPCTRNKHPIATQQVDVSDSGAVNTAFAKVVAEAGRLDLVAHVAGVAPDSETKARAGEFQAARLTGQSVEGFDGITELSDDAWRSLVEVNLDGSFYVVRAALQAMVPNRCGAIVTVSSAAALSGRVGFAHYSASKAGMRMLTQAAALEAVGYGIRINAVAPGSTQTAMHSSTPQALLDATGGVPIGRKASPDEMAAVIAFLLSDDASYIVGETINANGGLQLA
jgi:NAD(P)-dependent dehydrogenase (short-subunit alcohol dehydrogenase family)